MERAVLENLRRDIDKLVCKYLKNNVFTACSIGVLKRKHRAQSADIYFYRVAGKDHNEINLDKSAVFDLASLTKPLVTVLCILSLIEEGRCHPDDHLDKYFQSLVPSDKQAITLYQLLTHSSGLPAHRPYYEELVGWNEKSRMKRLVERIIAEKLLFPPTTDTLYSDLGFILLGRIIEIASGESLDTYWRRKIIAPLHLENDLFFASTKEEGHHVYVPTGRCRWSNMSLSGHVHDDNCRALGGIAGHAGLFGTVGGVLNLCREILLCYHGQGQHSAFTSETLCTMLDKNEGGWVCGFDSPTQPVSSSGKYFSEKTIGHLGFTGTSFWIDLQQQIIIVLLTNRVFCGDQLAAIQRFRPLVHDVIMEYSKKNTREG